MAPRTKSKKVNKDKYGSISTITSNSSSSDIPSLENIPQDLLKSLRSGYGNSTNPRPLFNNNANNFHDFYTTSKNITY